MRYLLDTDTCIHALRGTTSVVRSIAAQPPTDISISSITTYELLTGVEKCADPLRERNRLDLLFSVLSQVTFDLAAAQAAARIRAALEERGEMMGPYDVLIAGQALSLGLTLVTGNVNEFSRVTGLAIEDWQTAVPP